MASSHGLVPFYDPANVCVDSNDDPIRIADLHVHTVLSDGWWKLPELADAAIGAGLSAIAITDHDDCAAGLALASYCRHRELGLEVIAGAEISAREDGRDIHVIGLGLEENIRPFMSFSNTVEAIIVQGAVPVMPHPVQAGLGQPDFNEILGLDVPVAIEVYNASMSDIDVVVPGRHRNSRNAVARAFHENHRHRLLGAVGGTDAHFRSVGRGLTGYRGNVLDSIRTGTTTVCYRRGFESLWPRDIVGYLIGLRRMDRRRRMAWNLS